MERWLASVTGAFDPHALHYAPHTLVNVNASIKKNHTPAWSFWSRTARDIFAVVVPTTSKELDPRFQRLPHEIKLLILSHSNHPNLTFLAAMHTDRQRFLERMDRQTESEWSRRFAHGLSCSLSYYFSSCRTGLDVGVCVRPEWIIAAAIKQCYPLIKKIVKFRVRDEAHPWAWTLYGGHGTESALVWPTSFFPALRHPMVLNWLFPEGNPHIFEALHCPMEPGEESIERDLITNSDQRQRNTTVKRAALPKANFSVREFLDACEESYHLRMTLLHTHPGKYDRFTGHLYDRFSRDVIERAVEEGDLELVNSSLSIALIKIAAGELRTEVVKYLCRRTPYLVVDVRHQLEAKSTQSAKHLKASTEIGIFMRQSHVCERTWPQGSDEERQRGGKRGPAECPFVKSMQRMEVHL
ncbi:hypothetical protein BJ742DRAFT_913135 [Cladochytrium replicatum]|nr:hypothetical protein BJ742DRAFT_913135 [Cladochytrium replicatum]